VKLTNVTAVDIRAQERKWSSRVEELGDSPEWMRVAEMQEHSETFMNNFQDSIIAARPHEE
jgi:hypothetical protein